MIPLTLRALQNDDEKNPNTNIEHQHQDQRRRV
jgi:hypothetical protein